MRCVLLGKRKTDLTEILLFCDCVVALVMRYFYQMLHNILGKILSFCSVLLLFYLRMKMSKCSRK